MSIRTRTPLAAGSVVCLTLASAAAIALIARGTPDSHFLTVFTVAAGLGCSMSIAYISCAVVSSRCLRLSWLVASVVSFLPTGLDSLYFEFGARESLTSLMGFVATLSRVLSWPAAQVSGMLFPLLDRHHSHLVPLGLVRSWVLFILLNAVCWLAVATVGSVAVDRWLRRRRRSTPEE